MIVKNDKEEKRKREKNTTKPHKKTKPKIHYTKKWNDKNFKIYIIKTKNESSKNFLKGKM